MGYKGYSSYSAYRDATDSPEKKAIHAAALEKALSDPNRTAGFGGLDALDPTGVLSTGGALESALSDPVSFRNKMIGTGLAVGGATMLPGLIPAGAAETVGTGSALDAAIAGGVEGIGTAAGTGAGLTTGSTLGMAAGTGATTAGTGASLMGLSPKLLGQIGSAGVDLIGSSMASSAAGKAAEASLQGQREQLEYLKEVDRLPRQYREAALSQIAGAAGLPGGEGTQQDLIDRAMQSPLYQAIMGGQQAGEEAILRTASATGGLRSGSAIDAVSKDAEQRQNMALLQSYEQQRADLGGLSGLPSGATNIANVMGNIGDTRGQGIQAQGQIFQQGLQGLSDIAGTVAGDYFAGRGSI